MEVVLDPDVVWDDVVPVLGVVPVDCGGNDELTHCSSGMYAITHLPLTRMVDGGQLQELLSHPGKAGQSNWCPLQPMVQSHSFRQAVMSKEWR